MSFSCIRATLLLNERKQFSRRWWIHPINKERGRLGCYSTMFTDLENDEEKFKQFFRYAF